MSSFSQVSIPETEFRMIKSSFINQEFKISICLPHEYANGDQSYPVLYVLDGNSVFGITAETVRLLNFFSELQGLIIIGIGYPDVSTFMATMGYRTRDLTPTETGWYQKDFRSSMSEAPSYSGEGGAAQFLQFLTHELKPLINTNYRTKPDDTALMGFSFGGLFGLYTLFNKPDAFKRYILGSPSIWWDDTIINLEKEYAGNNDDLNAWLFMSVGGEEPELMKSDMFKIASSLKNRQFKSLEMYTHYFDGDGHMSVVPAFISRSLREAYHLDT